MINQLLIQYFHWYYNDEKKLWNKTADEAKHLQELGVTLAWLPPAYKGTSGGVSAGYDCYDLYDLGEFDQKNSKETRYGNKDEYLNAIKALKEAGIGTIADVVFNHKAGGDELEKISVRKVDPENRMEFISEVMEIEAWTKFTFPARKGKYSEFIWDHRCFSGIDWAEDLKEEGIFSIQNEYGDSWEDVPSNELGNYDYLMFNDIDYRNQEVREELKRWGEWYYNTCGMEGFRLDAVKHIASDFLDEWLDHMRNTFKKDFFVVAENWVVDNLEELLVYIDMTKGRMQLFDSLLHHNLYAASHEHENYDLCKIFDGTLVQSHPTLAVTFVDNHDSQPLQALESYIEYWFRPLAYALILLREGGIPCLFYPDLYSSTYTDKDKEGDETEVELVSLPELPELCRVRKELSYGIQRDYLNHANCIGWTREGTDEQPGSGIAVLLSNGEEGYKEMETGKRNAGKTFIDAMGKCDHEVVADENGWAEFKCEAKSASVWIVKPD
ncbi:alpha-amylase [Pedobacter metabolipauper]|uniref:Alpha-amylase n=1 Tax=Pedobacter metabolipauper TaxID=425513 RepID=A0A4R6SSU3_9SPHI|nr:alpha-amylase [Pedobacter metabolipauper]TDQ06935.1 alpha-amylase [Pedobacter metabolipauper]